MLLSVYAHTHTNTNEYTQIHKHKHTHTHTHTHTNTHTRTHTHTHMWVYTHTLSFFLSLFSPLSLQGITVENKTRHALFIRIAPNANDTTMVAVQGGIKASATGGTCLCVSQTL